MPTIETKFVNPSADDRVTAVLRAEHTIAVCKTIIYIHEELGLIVNMGEGFLGDTIIHVLKEARRLQKVFPDFNITLDDNPTPHREDGGHAKGIAVDINVFTRDPQGKLIYLNNHPDHRCWKEIRRFWESTHTLARWIGDDQNHLGFINKGVI